MKNILSCFLLSLVFSCPALAEDINQEVFDFYEKETGAPSRDWSNDTYRSKRDDDPFDVSPLKREDRVKNINKPKRSYQRFDNGISSQTKSSEDVLENMMSKY